MTGDREIVAIEMVTALLFYCLTVLLLAACSTPANAQPVTAPKIALIATPTSAIPTPASYLGQYKTYNFDTSSDLGFNQKWFFQVKSGGTNANPNDFSGKLCFRARETRWVIRDWGSVVNGEWIAFEYAPWKKVGDVWGLGVCLSASCLREVAELGGMKAVEVLGIGAQERVVTVPTHPPVFGVEQKYWTNIWSCNCSIQRDLRITNPYDVPVCLAWRMMGDHVVIWVSRN
ncbi:MAG: hypothetical protein FJ009_04150 [Chloroflexi bacterium]|nr:hypothetical protein [Chloroflexota bacterium]